LLQRDHASAAAARADDVSRGPPAINAGRFGLSGGRRYRSLSLQTPCRPHSKVGAHDATVVEVVCVRCTQCVLRRSATGCLPNQETDAWTDEQRLAVLRSIRAA